MRQLPLILLLVLLTGCNLIAPTGHVATPSTATSLPGEERLVVAWVENGNLMVWQTGDSIPRRVASGGVVQPYIAPDGNNIAFTRGPNGATETLWSVDVLGTAEQQIVGERPRGYIPGTHQVGDVAWLDEAVLYFNTLSQAGPAYVPVNDLYRANIRTREVALILAPTEGGRFSISPDKQTIVIVYPGTYGRQDGRIAALDPLKIREPRDLLFFVGVATGSERAFYPTVQWLPDSSAVLTAIPDSDLVYADSDAQFEIPLTRLWRLPIANPSDRELLGSLRISFFGLPRWSDDGEAMTFLRRAPGTNDFTAYVGDRTGANDRALYAGTAGTIEQPQWIPDSRDFFYARAEPDSSIVYYIGGIERESQRLSEESVLLPIFVSRDAYVYASIGNGRIDMRFARMGAASQFIGSAGTAIPIFDAVLVGG
jgi:hypothetical protein